MGLLHYSSTFKSELNQEWTITIWSTADATGTDLDFSLSSEGFKLNYKKGTKLRLAEIQPSDITIGFLVQNDTEKDFVHALLGSDQGDWFIRIYRGGSIASAIYWAGWVTPAYSPYKDISYPYRVNIKANDSIGRLVDKYNNSVETSGADDYKPLFYPVQFFHDLYDIDTLLGSIDYKYIFAFDWFNQATTYGQYVNPIRKTYYNRAAFVEENSNFPLIIGNYLHELKGLLKTMGGKFFFSDGFYRIQQDNGLDSDTISYFMCVNPNNSATEFKVEDTGNAITIDNSEAPALSEIANIVNGSTYTYEPELNSVRAKYIHGNKGIIFNTSQTFENLTTIGILGQGSNSYVLNLNLYAQEVWDNSVVNPASSSVFPTQGSLITCVFECVLKVGNYYLGAAGGGWSTNSANTFLVVAGTGAYGTQYPGWGLPPIGNPLASSSYLYDDTTGYDRATAKFTQAVDIPALPAYGEVQFKFTPTFYYWANEISITQISWSNLLAGPANQNASFGTPFSSLQKILVTPNICSLLPAEAAEEEDNSIGSSFICSQSPSTQSADLDLGEVPLGEPVQEGVDNTINTLASFDGSNYIPTTGFRRGSTGTYLNPTQLLLNEYLQGQDKPVTILQATIISNTYCPHMVLKYNDVIDGAVGRWVFLRGSFIASKDQWKGEWYKLDLTPTPTYSDEAADINTEPTPEVPPKILNAQSPLINGDIIQVISIPVVKENALTNLYGGKLKCSLKSGQKITLTDRNGNTPLEVIVDGDHGVGATTISIESINPKADYNGGSNLLIQAADITNFIPDNLAPGVSETAIYIKPQDFNITDDNNMVMYSKKEMGSIQGTEYDRREIYCSTFIPVGYQITAVDVYSNQNRDFDVKSSRVVSNTTVLEESGGTSNTTLSVIPAWESVVDEYIIITFYPGATTDEIYGAMITIDEV
jgi:hypothetical protein